MNMVHYLINEFLFLFSSIFGFFSFIGKRYNFVKELSIDRNTGLFLQEKKKKKKYWPIPISKLLEIGLHLRTRIWFTKRGFGMHWLNSMNFKSFNLNVLIIYMVKSIWSPISLILKQWCLHKKFHNIFHSNWVS